MLPAIHMEVENQADGRIFQGTLDMTIICFEKHLCTFTRCTKMNTVTWFQLL